MSNKSKTLMCDKCGKSFKSQQYLRIHLNKTIPCDKKHFCSKCGRKFPTPSKLRTHLSRKTPCVIEEIPIVSTNNNENKCDKETNMAQVMKMLVAQNQQLMEQNQQLMSQQVAMVNTTINNNNNTTINNVQQNMYVNVTFCNFGSEDLNRLDPNKVMNLLQNHADDFIPKMIEHVHANPEMPEYHNVFYDSQKEKAIVFTKISDSEQSWRMRDIRDVSEVLTNKIKEHIKPGTGPYFDMAMKTKDYDIANNISQIRDNKWDDDEVIDKNKGVLTKVKNNNGFSELIDVIE